MAIEEQPHTGLNEEQVAAIGDLAYYLANTGEMNINTNDVTIPEQTEEGLVTHIPLQGGGAYDVFDRDVADGQGENENIRQG
jgi:hypothetical protein